MKVGKMNEHIHIHIHISIHIHIHIHTEKIRIVKFVEEKQIPETHGERN